MQHGGKVRGGCESSPLERNGLGLGFWSHFADGEIEVGTEPRLTYLGLAWFLEPVRPETGPHRVGYSADRSLLGLPLWPGTGDATRPTKELVRN